MKLKWTFEKLQEEALKYTFRSEFQKSNKKAYSAAQKRGFLNQICSHMRKRIDIKGENHPQFKWTNEMLQIEALKYNTKKEFMTHNNKAYQTAKSRRIINNICFHMPNRTPRSNDNNKNAWSFEEMKEEALKYKTRTEFSNNSNAYQKALRKNLIEELCGHMKKSKGVSLKEKELFDIIKKRHSSAKRIRSKVEIEGKTYIKRFEIDIFVPELNKGIEFDGNYWHSFEGLKSFRKNWPDEDIQNYHQIKDDHFLSKGIKLLHIQELDWINNKKKCIKQCFDFLENKE